MSDKPIKKFNGFYVGEIVIVDIETVPQQMRMDYRIRNKNVTEGKRLCEWCDGTGNELYSMYRKCPKCGGDGIAPVEM